MTADGAGAKPRRRRGRGPAESPGRRSAAPLDPAAPERLDPEAAASLARSVCLRLLTDRPRTRAELATALRKRGVPEDCADSVLSRFGEVGLIDDVAFADAWVSSRHAARGLARAALAVELRARGVAPAIVSGALDQVDPATEIATARRLVSRRLATMHGLSPDVSLRRLVGMLGRKGYPIGIAVSVVRDALAVSVAEDDFAMLAADPDG